MLLVRVAFHEVTGCFFGGKMNDVDVELGAYFINKISLLFI